MKVAKQIAMVMNLDKSALAATCSASPLSRCGPRGTGTSGSATSKPVPAWATPAAGRTKKEVEG